MKLAALRALFPTLSDPNDSLLLVSRLLAVSKASLLARDDVALTDADQQKLGTAASQLAAGLPLPYVLGEWDFFGRSFTVNPDVLIPRPETEMIIELALQWLKEHPTRQPSILDVGCGTGIIPITLSLEVASARCVAVDISESALKVASQNAHRLGCETRVQFIRSDLLAHCALIAEEATILTANLPYIPTATLKGLEVNGKEPTIALDGGEDGLDRIKALLKQIHALRKPPPLILLEMEARQGPALLHIARSLFPRATAKVHQDLAGHDRVLEIRSAI